MFLWENFRCKILQTPSLELGIEINSGEAKTSHEALKGYCYEVLVKLSGRRWHMDRGKNI